MLSKNLPNFPYGAVYYRYSNPPQEDWEKDYQIAAEDGNNIFRHWFLWSAIEVAPGKFDWSRYDRQLDLAAENNMKTIIAEMITAAPEWAFRKYDHARFENRDGSKVHSQMSVSCVTGGFPGLCLDNDDAKIAAENFLKELANRYKDHPGLGGYDIWNECNISSEVCYCSATVNKFREWLKNKYGDLKTLGLAWHRPSYANWEDVQPSRDTGPYPDVLDWLKFRIDNAYKLMNWRKNIIREIDPSHKITAHGVAATFTGMAPRAADDWKAANEVDIYGYTWGSSRHGDEPWKQWHAVDLVRSSSRGKPFWHAEAYGGPLWMQSQVIGKPRNEGRIARPEDIRLWNMQSFAAGASGLLFLRWRPLLDGPLFGAFGPYGMDGSRTERSEMSTSIAKWVGSDSQKRLWQSKPVKGDIGIVYVPESQLYSYAQQGDTKFYSDSMEGSYQGFFDNNIQADWVHIDDIENYDLLYLPYPIMLESETSERLKAWVKDGGKLISEGCPAYFGDNGRVGTVQPNHGLDELFGAKESYVEFTPDLLGDLQFEINGLKVNGSIFMQGYEVNEGKAIGWYEDGKVAAVENNFGQGKVILLGTFPGAGYTNNNGNKEFFSKLLAWTGKEQQLKISDSRVTARLHTGDGGTYLWVTNPTELELSVRISLSQEWSALVKGKVLWGKEDKVKISENELNLVVNSRNAVVIELKQ